ncbi:MAG: glycosyltransferase family 4 protein [Anaerolineales bacterium]|nr:glycosyltransferase family 4 protein [Anaerolineales bacterium]
MQVRAHAMAASLVKQGHRVTVLTEMPNHPAGIVHPAYRGKLLCREKLDGIDVVRVWVKASPRKTFNTRLAFYISYMINAALRGLLLSQSYHVIFANSPPLFVGAAGLALSYLRRTPFVLEVQDLWPESAVALGELNNPRYIKWATYVEERCYQRAKKIVTVTDGIYNRLRERGYPAEKLTKIENGSNTELFRPQPAEAAQLQAKLGLGDKFIALYAGLMGLAYDFGTVIETARLLQAETDIHFVLVGDGPRRYEVEALIQSSQLPNLTLLPGQPLEAMPAYFSAANVTLIPLRNLELFLGTRPVKMFDAWACQCPVIVSVIGGEAQQLVETAQGGLVIEPENPAELARAIVALRNDPTKGPMFGQNGQRHVLAHYSFQTMALKLEQILAESANKI